MQAVEALVNRVSCGKLLAPGPGMQQLAILKAAALRAADHGSLKPWRFLVIEGSGLNQLGQLYLRAAQAKDGPLTETQTQRYLAMPLRAPMVIVAIAENQAHDKVPAVEQLLATGAAVQNMITAAYAQGLGAYWRTGFLAYDETVKEGLGVQVGEAIIGFVYLGTPATEFKQTPETNPDDFFHIWPPQ